MAPLPSLAARSQAAGLIDTLHPLLLLRRLLREGGRCTVSVNFKKMGKLNFLPFFFDFSSVVN